MKAALLERRPEPSVCPTKAQLRSHMRTLAGHTPVIGDCVVIVVREHLDALGGLAYEFDDVDVEAFEYVDLAIQVGVNIVIRRVCTTIVRLQPICKMVIAAQIIPTTREEHPVPWFSVRSAGDETTFELF